MSFVSFAANFGGTPPAPFAPFTRGDMVFYLVGVDTENGAPAPASQLQISTKTDKGRGQNPVDSITETAKGWQGRRLVTVATRAYSWERYTRGAKAAARDESSWSTPEGEPLRIWSYVVSVDNARSLGYRVPGGTINARRGNRGVGHENNARGTVAGRSVVPVATPEPVVTEPVRAGLPEWAQYAAAMPEAVESRRVANAARAARIAARNRAPQDREPDQLVPDEERAVRRVEALDLDSSPVGVLVDSSGSDVDPGEARFALLDLD
jgi:hypothetical protein